MQRYFVEKKNGQFIFKEGDEHHIKNVMRLKNKDQIICIHNGKNYLCEIEYKDKEICLHVLQECEQENELKKDILLYQAVIKNDHFDFVIQKATELGVKKIIPTICERSVVKIENAVQENKKLIRYGRIIKEASEQSRRNELCEILPYCKIKEITLPADTLGLLAYEENGDVHSFANVLKELPKYKKIAIVIGPEGGFTKDEVTYLSSLGFKNISLGKRILRSETASIYTLSVLAYYLEVLENE